MKPNVKINEVQADSIEQVVDQTMDGIKDGEGAVIASPTGATIRVDRFAADDWGLAGGDERAKPGSSLRGNRETVRGVLYNVLMLDAIVQFGMNARREEQQMPLTGTPNQWKN